jgi:hypothetical protein
MIRPTVAVLVVITGAIAAGAQPAEPQSRPTDYRIGKYSVRFGPETRVDGTEIVVPQNAQAVADAFTPLLPAGWRIEIGGEAATIQKCVDMAARAGLSLTVSPGLSAVPTCVDRERRAIYSIEEPVDLLDVIKQVIERPIVLPDKSGR